MKEKVKNWFRKISLLNSSKVKEILKGYINSRFLSSACFILSITLLVIFRNDFLNILKTNRITLLLLLPFIFFFIALWLIKLQKNDSLLVLAGLAITILFFLFQGTFERNGKVDAILGLNDYNCTIARGDIRKIEDSKTGSFLMRPFISDLYKENLGFIYREFGKQKYITTLMVVSRMEQVNGLVDTVKLINALAITAPNNERLSKIDSLIKMYNEQIITLNNDVKNIICAENKPNITKP